MLLVFVYRIAPALLSCAHRRAQVGRIDDLDRESLLPSTTSSEYSLRSSVETVLEQLKGRSGKGACASFHSNTRAIDRSRAWRGARARLRLGRRVATTLPANARCPPKTRTPFAPSRDPTNRQQACFYLNPNRLNMAAVCLSRWFSSARAALVFICVRVCVFVFVCVCLGGEVGGCGCQSAVDQSSPPSWQTQRSNPPKPDQSIISLSLSPRA